MDKFIFKTGENKYHSSSSIVDFTFDKCTSESNKKCVVLSVYSYNKNRFHFEQATDSYEFSEDSKIYEKMNKIREKSIN